MTRKTRKTLTKKKPNSKSKELPRKYINQQGTIGPRSKTNKKLLERSGGKVKYYNTPKKEFSDNQGIQYIPNQIINNTSKASTN